MAHIRAVAAAIGAIVATGLFVAFVWWKDAYPPKHTSADSVLPRRGGTTSGPQPPSPNNFIYGTKGDDDILGTEGSDTIDALAGQDRIRALGGDDVLDGGTDSDWLLGGSGNDTYVIAHHGGGADVILEEDGVDTLLLSGGHLGLIDIEFLRHRDDLLLRWDHKHPADAVLVRQWFAGDRFQLELLRLPDGTALPIGPLADRARLATAEDLIHFPDPSGERR